jgi:hypothetical protein
MDSNQSVSGAEEAVFVKSQELPEGTPQVQGAVDGQCGHFLLLDVFIFNLFFSIYPVDVDIIIFLQDMIGTKELIITSSSTPTNMPVFKRQTWDSQSMKSKEW